MTPRLAVRAIILQNNRLLLVNAWAPDANVSATAAGLWCAPGGGVERGSSLPDNLKREVMEETGLTVSIGAPCLVNEFHDPASGFHQVDVYFRATIVAGQIAQDWQDPENIVSKRKFFDRAELEAICVKPDSLRRVPWDAQSGITYDPLEPILR